jgi:DNA glycosylase AlkZ-like
VAAETLTTRDLNRATLARQMLLEREKAPVTKVVERLAGMQAQEPRPPFIGLWTRVEGFEREQLQKALQDRKVVRAMLMRATLHLVSARDYAAFRPALQPVLAGAMRSMSGSFTKGLELEKVLPAARELLDERPRGFNELRKLLSDQFPAANHRALGYSVRLHMPLVMVPTDDGWGFPRVAEFTPADDWLGKPIREEGPAHTLAKRYLAAFGPASAKDLQVWSGLAGAKDVLDGMRSKLTTFQDERGRELFDLPDGPRPGADVPAPLRFLPDFDNLVLAHDDRTRVIPEEYRGRITTKNLRVRATFLVDGFVAGTWKAERKGKAATLTIEPFKKLPRGVTGPLKDEAAALLAFMEPEATKANVKVV